MMLLLGSQKRVYLGDVAHLMRVSISTSHMLRRSLESKGLLRSSKEISFADNYVARHCVLSPTDRGRKIAERLEVISGLIMEKESQ